MRMSVGQPFQLNLLPSVVAPALAQGVPMSLACRVHTPRIYQVSIVADFQKKCAADKTQTYAHEAGDFP